MQFLRAPAAAVRARQVATVWNRSNQKIHALCMEMQFLMEMCAVATKICDRTTFFREGFPPECPCPCGTINRSRATSCRLAYTIAGIGGMPVRRPGAPVSSGNRKAVPNRAGLVLIRRGGPYPCGPRLLDGCDSRSASVLRPGVAARSGCARPGRPRRGTGSAGIRPAGATLSRRRRCPHVRRRPARRN